VLIPKGSVTGKRQDQHAALTPQGRGSMNTPRSPTLSLLELAGVELHALVLTPFSPPVESVMPRCIVIVTTQSRRHPFAIPAALLAMSGPTRWSVAVMPALVSSGTSEPGDEAALFK
jgi:hypothetical protein